MIIMKSLIYKALTLFSYVFPYAFSQWISSYLDLFFGIWIKQTLNNPKRKCRIYRHVRIVGGKNITIGDGTIIYGHCVVEAIPELNGTQYSPRINIGQGCAVGEYSHITAINSIEIGNGVLTGRRVLISDNNHGEFVREDLVIPPRQRRIVSKGPCIIEDNVWIGEGAIILGGVRIGESSVIAANAVVTKDVPPFSLAAGVPARTIKTIK